MRYHSVGIAAQIPGEREKAPHAVARARAITRRYPVRVLPAEYPEVLWFTKLKEVLSLSQLSYKTGVLYVQFSVSCEIGCLIVTHFPQVISRTKTYRRRDESRNVRRDKIALG